MLGPVAGYVGGFLTSGCCCRLRDLRKGGFALQRPLVETMLARGRTAKPLESSLPSTICFLL